MTETAVRAAFADQAGWCKRLGSPFTALLCETIGERLDRTTAVGRRVLDWPGDPSPLADILPGRLAGGLHAHVLGGAAPDLAALYPPNPMPDADALWAAVAQALVDYEATLLPFLDVAPQTNEIGRSGPLMVGLLTLAAQTGLPMSILELGSSAGLNLILDRYAYDLGGVLAGDPASPILIRPEWEGPPPPFAPVRIIQRRGVDIAPIDITDPDQRTRLSAYVWAGQTERMARLQAAMDLALTDPPRLERADAADWLEQVLTLDPEPGVCRVVQHTVAFQYFPAKTQDRILARLQAAGARAGAQAPLAWLRFENDPQFEGKASLRLTFWPTGDERLLGLGHAHGTNFQRL